MIEVRPDLLVVDPIQRPKFRSMSFHYTGIHRLETEELKGQIRAVKKYSKLPKDWRESFGNLPFSELIREPNFRTYLRGLDGVSGEDLIFQLFDEVWPKIRDGNKDSGK